MQAKHLQGDLYPPSPPGMDRGGLHRGRWVSEPSRYQYHGWPGQRLNVERQEVKRLIAWFPREPINKIACFSGGFVSFSNPRIPLNLI